MTGLGHDPTSPRVALDLLFLGGGISRPQYELMCELPDRALHAFVPLMLKSPGADEWLALLALFASEVIMHDSGHVYTSIQPEIEHLTVGWLRRALVLRRELIS